MLHGDSFAELVVAKLIAKLLACAPVPCSTVQSCSAVQRWTLDSINIKVYII